MFIILLASTFPDDTEWFTTESSDRIISNYRDELTSNNNKYPETDKYYQAIQIMVNTSGTYDLTSISNMDTYACLYQDDFNPTDITRNLISCNDDSNGNQFGLTNYLQAGITYTLVFTTYSPNVQGSYTVVGSGPNEIYFTPIDIPQSITTTTTARPTSSISIYTSALTVNSGQYLRNENSSSFYYYEAIQLNVNTTGTYTFTSQSNIDTYGYIYQGNFYPSYSDFNIRAKDDDTAGNSQFQLTAFLRADITYIYISCYNIL